MLVVDQKTRDSREASLTATQGRPDQTGTLLNNVNTLLSTRKGSRAAGSADVESGGQRSPARGADAVGMSMNLNLMSPPGQAQLAMTE